jgi:amidohydrolase
VDVVAVRRALHARPELSFQEVETTRLIEERLAEMGLAPYRLAPTGVLADIVGDAPGPTIALRADIDALPIQEETGAPYASRTPGVMHACGHDGHTAMLLAAALRLVRERRVRRGSVRLVFQAAEETLPGGARTLVEQGAMAGVQRVFGIHLLSSLPCGWAEVSPGPMTANADDFEVVFHGRGGHAALPHETTDAVVMAAAFVQAAQTVVARSVDPMAPAVVTIGMLAAGQAPNVVAERAVLRGTARTLDEGTRDTVEARLGELARKIAEAHGGTASFTYRRGYPAVVNDAAAAELFRAAAADVLGADRVGPHRPSMVGEDFSYYQSVCPGAFLMLGSGGPGKDFPHHHARFDIDERALELGVSLWVRLVERALAEG